MRTLSNVHGQALLDKNITPALLSPYPKKKRHLGWRNKLLDSCNKYSLDGTRIESFSPVQYYPENITGTV